MAEQIYQAAQATGTDTNVANNPALFKRNATPEEHFFRRIHVAVMEYERDLVVHRLQMGLQAAQQKRKKVRGRKTIMEKLAPMSQQKRALKKLILQRRAGKFGFRPLARKMSQALRLKQTMAMETCKRVCQQLARAQCEGGTIRWRHNVVTPKSESTDSIDFHAAALVRAVGLAVA